LSNIPESEEGWFSALTGFPQEIPNFPKRVKQAFFHKQRTRAQKSKKTRTEREYGGLQVRISAEGREVSHKKTKKIPGKKTGP